MVGGARCHLANLCADVKAALPWVLPGLLSSSANSQHAYTCLVKVYIDISLNLT